MQQMVNSMDVTSHDIEGGRVFTLSGELDVTTADGLADRLTGPPGALVVLDLSGLTFMDSSGIGAIHAARRLTIKNGGTLVVSRPSAQVHRVLEITGLDTWIKDWDPDWSG
jgi:anti-sigma B factor antagonist